MKFSQLGLVSLVLMLSGCQPDSASPTRLKTVAFSRMPKTALKVCWEISSNETAEFRREMQESTEKAFAGSVLTFESWQECLKDGSDDVRFFIYDDAESAESPAYKAYVDELIAENGGDPVGVGHPHLRDTTHPAYLVLNRTFQNADPRLAPLAASFTAEGMHNLSISSSLHEIGHAIGLKHEDSHPERTCDDFAEGLSDTDTVVSGYNPFSFMSRCYYRTFNYDLGLVLPNRLDIEGINKLYADAPQ